MIGGLKPLKSPFIINSNLCAGQVSIGLAVMNVEVVEALMRIAG